MGIEGESAGGHAIEDEGISIPDKNVLNFVGANVTVTNIGDKTTVTITSGGGSAHTIFSATHTDSLASVIARGGIMVANLTPLYAQLPLGLAGRFLRSNGTDLLYSLILLGDIPVGVELTANKDIANGYAGLDAGNKVLLTKIPNLPTLGTLPSPSRQVAIVNAEISTVDALKITTGELPNARLANLPVLGTLPSPPRQTAITNAELAGLIANAKLLNLPLLGTLPSPPRQVAIVNAEISTVDTSKITTGKLVNARIGIGSAYQRKRTNAGATDIEDFTEKVAFVFVVGNGVDVITTGIKVVVRVEFDCEITRWTMMAKESGSIVIDINRYTSLANYDSGTKASITGSDIPDLVTDKSDDSTALTGWTVVLNEGDILEAEVDSITTITRNTLSLRATKRG